MRHDETCDRLNARRRVLLDARCHTSSWHVMQVELADLSEGGCCIVGGAAGLRVGQDVRMRIANLKPVKGTVRWIRERDAGVEFRTALGSQAIAQIAAHYELAGMR